VTDALGRLTAALADRYAIERELGQGGMATVYLAEDIKHHRKVALKVLRPEIAVTVGAGRFSREIEVAARLQHPNILPLLDSGEAEGFFFYVMPYVAGESLRDRLARGGELPIPDVVRILMEVADALSHAHAHGVVHRDIKPDNVLLSGRHALVADFGVAKAVTEATGRQMLTSTGVALGTPTYMAPEQAMADPHQDHRVDIYALGVLGYELLAGRAPFSATTAQEMLAAHVTAVPDPVERYRPMVSPALAQIIMKCLAKKPADRWQTAEELLTHLEPLATPSGGTTPTQTQPTTAVSQLPRWAKWAAGVVVVAVIALLVGQLLKPKPLAVTASDITQVTSEPGVEFQPAISPDGNEVAYVAGPIGLPRLFVRSAANIAGGGAVRLGDTVLGSEWLPSWSPSGQLVRFWGCRGNAGFYGRTGCAMRETGKLGGAIRTVTVPRGVRWSWSPDGTRVAFVRGDTILTSSATDTAAHRVAIHRQQDFWELHSLVWSPDGKRIAYVSGNPLWLTSGNVSGCSIWVVDAGGGEPQRLTSDEHLNVSPAWLDRQHLLFVSDRDGPRAAYVVEVGPRGARGEPHAIPGVVDAHSISYSTVARRFTYSKLTLRQNIWAFPLDRSAPISIRDGRPLTTGTAVIEEHDVSPDGRWIVFDSNRRGNMDIYKMPLAGGEPEPLADSRADEMGPHWSPGGREIAFFSNIPGRGTEIQTVSAEGGAPVTVVRGPDMNDNPAWSPSGLEIAFWSTRTGRWGTWVVSRDSVGGTWHEAGPLAGCQYVADWAPDGSGVLCYTNGDLALVSPQGRALWRRNPAAAFGLTSIGGLRYSRDGRTIYEAATHQDGRKGVWAIPVAGGAARLVIAFDDPALVAPGMISVGPDHLYLTVSQYESDIWVATLRY